eukprot:TRINITY_DN7314_c0_g1_i1.p2 TRINITY_DN7314_c0_g1~~TRINITY_DN7314_c0_g1_i1.p2  ORF type:complete len:108 (+),score=13.00 TRINITY_DN7314_c0_g1_i1:56-379(+)
MDKHPDGGERGQLAKNQARRARRKANEKAKKRRTFAKDHPDDDECVIEPSGGPRPDDEGTREAGELDGAGRTPRSSSSPAAQEEDEEQGAGCRDSDEITPAEGAHAL